MIEVEKNEGDVEITDSENLFTDLGFSEPKSIALKMKADLYCRIVAAVRAAGYTQHAVSKILDIPQPRVSNIMRGKIDNMSIEALLEYAHRLDSSLRVELVSDAG